MTAGTGRGENKRWLAATAAAIILRSAREQGSACPAGPVQRQLRLPRHGSPGPYAAGPFGRSSGERIGAMWTLLHHPTHRPI